MKFLQKLYDSKDTKPIVFGHTQRKRYVMVEFFTNVKGPQRNYALINFEKIFFKLAYSNEN